MTRTRTPRSFAQTTVLVVLVVLLLLAPTVPASPALAAPASDVLAVHVVRYGETLAGIAARYGVSPWAIAQANGLANINRIYVGQSLIIPGGAVTGNRIHTVTWGETLNGIARYYGVSLWDIMQANAITNPNRIYPGQQIVIPTYLPPATLPATAGESRYYTQTGHWVRFGFLEFFDQYGGVDVFGYPITDEYVENGVVVQYFQRMRLEWYPNNPAGQNVQMAPLGRLVHGQVDPPVPPTDLSWYATRRYFSETGHSAAFGFLSFFESHGGLRVFGPPITEEFVENGLTVQYYVNARFEWHPDNADPYKVQLGLLGTQVYSSGGLAPYTSPAPTPTPAPGEPTGSLARVYSDPAVRSRLGAPTAAQFTVWLAEEPFQGGVMVWRADTQMIYAAYNDGTWQPSSNLWSDGQPMYIVDVPPGLYAPDHGFGYLWRSSKTVRDRLGWATAPERGYNASIQGFQRGLMFWSDSRNVYVLYSDGTWQKYPE